MGALNGSHIVCFPQKVLHLIFRNPKGFLSQNCLFECNFDFEFVFTLLGMEGSATDAAVWQFAIGLWGGFNAPEGQYYLADGRYPSCAWILIPYRDRQYQLAEWGRTAVRDVSSYHVQ